MNAVASYRPHAVTQALQALADTDALLIKAAAIAFLHRDADLADALRRQRNINAQCLRDARGE